MSLYCKSINYLIPKKCFRRRNLAWKIMGTTPHADRRCTPQGKTFVDGNLLLSVCFNDKRNVIFLLKFENNGCRQKKLFEMPTEAVHTSGLDWDGNYLWAIDYISHKIYKIDYRLSLRESTAVVVDSVPTCLKGSGSLTRLIFENEEYLAITDFMNSGYTYLVSVKDLFLPGEIPAKARHKYRNGHFNQGIVWDGRYLYEANGNFGKDTIYKIEIEKAVNAGHFKAGIVCSYRAPHLMIEDLTTDGESIWTSDEHSFYLYKTKIC